MKLKTVEPNRFFFYSYSPQEYQRMVEFMELIDEAGLKRFISMEIGQRPDAGEGIATLSGRVRNPAQYRSNRTPRQHLETM